MTGPRADVEVADAGAGGCGAPPPPERRNEAPIGLTREYRDERISVLWFAERCIHSAECIRALPGVFDPQRRPWIVLGAAAADEIAEAVLRCPTGALHYVRHDGGPQEPSGGTVEIRTVRDGPYHVRGPAEVVTEGGEPLRRDTRMALCRCGKSAHMPFCDNAHRSSGFRDPGRAPAAPEPSAARDPDR